jgi:hypothetical protein
MDMDSWSFEEDVAEFEEEELEVLTLDGDGDGDEDADEDSDADGDENEEELECLADQLENALKQIVSTLTQDEKNLITGTILGFCQPSTSQYGTLSTAYYKGFYFLLVTRDKTTPPGNVPLYNASANYQSAPASQQQIIQLAIPNWDAISDSALWNDLSSALGESSFSDSSALSADLILSFQFARLATEAEHVANDNYATAWGAAALSALAVTLAATYSEPDQLPDMCSFMSTYSASTSLGAPPFALGAQAVLLAYTIVLGYSTAEELEKCVGEE